MPEGRRPGRLSAGQMVMRGTVIAAIITVPSLAAFVTAWTVLDDLVYAAIIGAVVHFVAMGFSFKISKKILVKG